MVKRNIGGKLGIHEMQMLAGKPASPEKARRLVQHCYENHIALRVPVTDEEKFFDQMRRRLKR